MSTVTTTNGVPARFGIEDVNPGAGTGRWIQTKGAELASVNPTSGEAISRVRQATSADYDEVVKTAQKSFETWRLVLERSSAG